MKRVLVADDGLPSRELLRAILEHYGHTVYEAQDGVEAVFHARASLPDLILLELQMPMLDGFGVARDLRADKRFAATPIIALTARAVKGDRERALSAGFTGYISKPAAVSVLRGVIEGLLG